jgi:hypothetical protein
MGDGPPDPKTRNPDWAGWQGHVAHPDAPAGGGGPGGFKRAGALGVDPPGPNALPNPLAPVAKSRVPDPDRGGVAAKGAAPIQNAPPTTIPSKTEVKVLKTAENDIAVYVEILEDGRSADPKLEGARTSFPPNSVVWKTPGYEHQTVHGKSRITKVEGPAELKGTITIQTVYGPTATPDSLSGYGRGTTPEDEKSGDVTLGFHESCHRADYLNYLKANALPTFGGKVGMSKTDFDASAQRFNAQAAAYFEKMRKDSINSTDEVGYKMSEYRSKGPRR